MNSLNSKQLNQAFSVLSEILEKIGVPFQIVVCGGSGLIALGLIERSVTSDVDIVALIEHNILIPPVPMPPELIRAANTVALALKLPKNWLNNGPSQNEGGLIQMGLPDGFRHRLIEKDFGDFLKVFFAGRLDQIHFKLWATVDQGGRHTQDLMDLKPNSEEMYAAAKWTLEKDVSKEFKMELKSCLCSLKYSDVSDRL
jgi:hypothetical protein